MLARVCVCARACVSKGLCVTDFLSNFILQYYTQKNAYVPLVLSCEFQLSCALWVSHSMNEKPCFLVFNLDEMPRKMYVIVLYFREKFNRR